MTTLEASRRDVLEAVRQAHMAAIDYERMVSARVGLTAAEAEHLRHARSTSDHIAVAEALLMLKPWTQPAAEQEAR